MDSPIDLYMGGLPSNKLLSKLADELPTQDFLLSEGVKEYLQKRKEAKKKREENPVRKIEKSYRNRIIKKGVKAGAKLAAASAVGMVIHKHGQATGAERQSKAFDPVWKKYNEYRRRHGELN